MIQVPQRNYLNQFPQYNAQEQKEDKEYNSGSDPIVSELKNHKNIDKLDPPEDFMCPISRQLMLAPVFTSDGHTYNREHIEKWFETQATSPKTNKLLKNKVLTPNFQLQSQILTYLESLRKAPTQIQVQQEEKCGTPEEELQGMKIR